MRSSLFTQILALKKRVKIHEGINGIEQSIQAKISSNSVQATLDKYLG